MSPAEHYQAAAELCEAAAEHLRALNPIAVTELSRRARWLHADAAASREAAQVSPATTPADGGES